MEGNFSAWDYYQPGWVHPEFQPYVRTKVRDRWGNTVSINNWEKQGCSELVNPALVRANWGMTFQKLFESDPCPNGFTRAAEGYCVQEPLKHQPVFYTDKAFIAKRQFWNGYGQGDDAPRRISEQTDMRSVNPLTGKYEVYFQPRVSRSTNIEGERNRVRYSRPFSVYPEKEKYDHSWGLAQQRGYQSNPTADSYLG